VKDEHGKRHFIYFILRERAAGCTLFLTQWPEKPQVTVCLYLAELFQCVSQLLLVFTFISVSVDNRECVKYSSSRQSCMFSVFMSRLSPSRELLICFDLCTLISFHLVIFQRFLGCY